MNNPTPQFPQPGISGTPGTPYPPYGMLTPPSKPAAEKKRRSYTAAERWLLLGALAVGVLWDRTMADIFNYNLPGIMGHGLFWLGYLLVCYLFNWQRLKQDKLLWTVAGFTAGLCVVAIVNPQWSAYNALTTFVIPAVLMAHAVVTYGSYNSKQVLAIARDFLCGWFIKPFSAIPHFFGASASTLGSSNRPAAKKALLGAAVSLPLLFIIVPLLGSADLVFGYFTHRLFAGLRIELLVGHTFLACCAAVLFYSFLWNMRYAAKPKVSPVVPLQINAVTGGVVLGAVLLVYLLFTAVQFTYLFARAGLPGELTYSEYARQGFWQLILICGINLALFGSLLQYGEKNPVLRAMLGSLLALTGVLLASAITRLGLYIATYGMTWLRLLSAWLLLYLVAVLVLCAVRMKRQSLPLIGVCAVILLGWYLALGCLNPDHFVENYNKNAPGIYRGGSTAYDIVSDNVAGSR